MTSTPAVPSRRATARGAVLALLLTATACVASGCRGSGHGTGAPAGSAASSGASASSTGPTPAGPATPGSVTVAPQANQDGAPGLVITGATVAVTADGSARLDMSVRNLGSAEDHLVSVTSAHASGTTLELDAAQRAAQAGQQPNDDGVPVAAGQTLVFGAAGGPSIVLRRPTGLTTGARVPFVVYFADIGLVHVTANVTRATR